MKRLLLIFTLFSGFVFGQIENFSIENSNIKWQTIYETYDSIDEIITKLKSNDKIKILNNSDNSISGHVKDFLMDYKNAGYSKLSAPAYMNENYQFEFDFKIDFKDGKYRATISNIKSKGLAMSIYVGGIGMSGDNESTLEAYVLKSNKNEFISPFKKAIAAIMNYSFFNLFDVTKYKKVKNDDW